MGRPQKLKEIVPGFWQILKSFWPYAQREKPLLLGSVIALLAEVGFRLLEPWPLKFIFDGVIDPEDGKSGIPAAIAHLEPMTLLIIAASALIIINGLRAFAAYLNTVGFALVGNRVLTRVRNDLYCHLQRLSLSFHNEARKGDLTIRVISDVGLLQDIVVTALLPLIANFLILVGMIVLMLWLNTELMLIAMGTIPLFWLVTQRLSRKIQSVSRQQRQQESLMASTTAESMSAIKIVQTLSLEDKFSQTFSSQSRRSLKDGVKAKRLAASLERSVDILITIATALVLGRGTQLVLDQSLTPGDLLVFLSYLKNAFRPVRDFAKYVGRIAKATAAGERILDLFRQTPEVADLPNAVDLEKPLGFIRFEQVSFAYHDHCPILKNIQLILYPGQTVALVGPSGSGKSTLIGLLLRLYDPTQGQICLDGQDLRNFTLASLRSQISVVLQENLLFAATVWENIAYGASDASEEDIIAAAKLANAHDFIIQNLPNGYDTVLGERGVTLSGGQQQRLTIARAAVRNAPILILDEPTTGLDQQNEAEVIEALERLAQDKTTLIVAHDLRLAARANHIIYLEQGEILEQGSHRQLLELKGRYAALYQIQSATRQFIQAESNEVSDASFC